MLEPRTADIFRADGAPLYKHQEQAIALAAQGESYVVTTGTGSGTSLCFFIPIVNAVLVEKRTRTAPRTRAIIIYPMNALHDGHRAYLPWHRERVFTDARDGGAR